ncbi:PAS domain S-box-containing protein [Ureibacillus xyleni]|uniref:PAS domain S-box-containing protein n=1 Tax=Ureibacillus xyleni TaxID=614648 RepID=A0A285TL79_9BACL|nr:PAS domain-containing protein [Ureibacillus xyleni]SOC22658.1 PAS domain S-box-containing protein [Ureibacillus xyleni]
MSLINQPNRFTDYTLYQFPSSKLNNSNDSVFIIELFENQFVYRYANNAGLDLIQLTGSVEGKTFEDLFPPFEVAFLRKYYLMAASSNQNVTFTTVKRGHGYYETELTPIRHSDSLYFLTVVRDISSKFEQLTNPLILENPTNNNEYQLDDHYVEFTLDYDGYFYQANKEIEKIIGYLPFELVGTNFTQLLSFKEIFKVKQHFQKALDGQTITFETELIHKNMKSTNIELKLKPFYKDGRIKGVSAIAVKKRAIKYS